MFKQTVTIINKKLDNKITISGVHFEEVRAIERDTAHGDSNSNTGLLLIKSDADLKGFDIGDYVIKGSVQDEMVLSTLKKEHNVYKIVKITFLLFGGKRHYEVEVEI